MPTNLTPEEALGLLELPAGSVMGAVRDRFQRRTTLTSDIRRTVCRRLLQPGLEIGAEGDGLFHASDRSRLHGAKGDGKILRIGRGRADDDRQRLCLHDAAGGLEAIQTRHMDIHDHHVRTLGAGREELQRGLSVVHRADHPDTRVRVQQLDQQHARHLRIVCHQHFDFVGVHILRSTRAGAALPADCSGRDCS